MINYDDRISSSIEGEQCVCTYTVPLIIRGTVSLEFLGDVYPAIAIDIRCQSLRSKGYV